jgi:hypothetical protein
MKTIRNTIFIITYSLLIFGCEDKKVGYSKKDAETIIKSINTMKKQNIDLAEALKEEIELLDKNIELTKTDGLKEKFITERNYKNIALEKLNFAIQNGDSMLTKVNLQIDSMNRVN